MGEEGNLSIEASDIVTPNLHLCDSLHGLSTCVDTAPSSSPSTPPIASAASTAASAAAAASTSPSHGWPPALRAVSLKDVVCWIDPLDGTKEFTKGLVEACTVLIGISIKVSLSLLSFTPTFYPSLPPLPRAIAFRLIVWCVVWCVALKGRAAAGVVHVPFARPPRTVWGAVGLGVVGRLHHEQDRDATAAATSHSHSAAAASTSNSASAPSASTSTSTAAAAQKPAATATATSAAPPNKKKSPRTLPAPDPTSAPATATATTPTAEEAEAPKPKKLKTEHTTSSSAAASAVVPMVLSNPSADCKSAAPSERRWAVTSASHLTQEMVNLINAVCCPSHHFSSYPAVCDLTRLVRCADECAENHKCGRRRQQRADDCGRKSRRLHVTCATRLSSARLIECVCVVWHRADSRKWARSDGIRVRSMLWFMPSVSRVLVTIRVFSILISRSPALCACTGGKASDAYGSPIEYRTDLPYENTNGFLATLRSHHTYLLDKSVSVVRF